MNKSDEEKHRTIEIKLHIQQLRQRREDLRRVIAQLTIELNHINGHYDISWKEKYGDKNE